MTRLGLAAVLCLAGHRAAAQTDSHAQPLVRWPEAVGFVVVTSITFVTDERIRGTIQGHKSGFRDAVAQIGNAFGNPRYVAPALALGTIGGNLAGWSDVHASSWRALKATGLATGTTLVLKSLIGRRRPEVSPDDPYRFSPIGFTFNSLPSGHTATAFALATSLAMDSRSDLVDIVLYGLATTTAFARMHIDKHWASDTVVGAGIGIVAARYVRRHDHSAGGGSVRIAGSFRF